MISTVYIAKTVYGGDGLGRLGDGRVVFVSGAFAGENVRAEIIGEKKRFVRAKLIEVVEPSPDRIAAPAKVVPGMVYAELAYPAEIAAKTAQLEDFLDRARLAYPKPLTMIGAPAADPFHYRNKAIYHFAKQGGRWAIGYRRENSHEIVEVTEDPLVVPAIDAKLAEIRAGVKSLLTQGPVAVRQATEREGKVTVRWSKTSGVKWWVGKPPAGMVLREVTAGMNFDVPSDGFYQVNPTAGEGLVAAVREEYLKDVALAPDILDLYCGVGVFGLALAAAGKAVSPRLTGIESGRQAVEFARRNAANLKLRGDFFAEEVGRNLRRIAVGPRTTVVIDPPRDGLEPGVAEWLARSRAPRIFYVSCDPATLTRDLRVLSAGYEIAAVKWIDMFPRTARFETFVSLRRKV